MSKSILVIGATGYLGGKVVDQLLSRKVKVRALVRQGSNSSMLEAKGISIFRGDLTQMASILLALKDIDVVISTAIGYSNRRKGDSLKSVDDGGNRNLVDAIKQAGVKRLVFTSVLTADQAPSVPHFWQKKRSEDYMAAAGINYVALRPGAFLDQAPANDFYASGLKKGKLMVMGSTSIKWTNILTDDLAKYLVLAAIDEDIPTGTIDLGMSEPMNAEMLVKYAAEYTGKPIQVGAYPWGILGPVLTLGGFFKPALRDLKKMFAYFFTGKYVADTTRQLKYFGELPSVKESVFRYCQQIGLPKAAR